MNMKVMSGVLFDFFFVDGLLLIIIYVYSVLEGGEASTSSPVKPTLNTTGDTVSSQDSKEHSENVNLGLK